jgi:hypothetical protein
MPGITILLVPAERIFMHRTTLTFPELGLIAGTRALLGAGIGMLVANHLVPEQRRSVGWTLIAVGLLTTLPLAVTALSRSTCDEQELIEEEPQ